MRFLWPGMLGLLVCLPLLGVWYVRLLRRRRRHAIRFPSLDLLRVAVAGARPWRRHVPPALIAAGIAVATVALARPVTTLTLSQPYFTLVLALDVSRSMQANDVEPTRMAAAQAAARDFIDHLPSRVRMSIVTFAGTAAVARPPTDDRQQLKATIDEIDMQRGTATGSALLVAMSVLFPEDPSAVESAAFDPATARTRGAPIDRAGAATAKDAGDTAPGSFDSGAIVLLSDGHRTMGPEPLPIAARIAARGVRVHTIGFGSRRHASQDPSSFDYYLRIDEDTLREVARLTTGEYFHAASSEDLKQVYRNVGTRVQTERSETEISALFGLLSALLVLLAAALSAWWFEHGLR